MYLFENSEVPLSPNGKEANKLEIEAGTLIQLHPSKKNPNNYSSKDRKSWTTVQVKDFSYEKQHIYENLYECSASNLLSVTETLWPYVIAIRSAEKRLQLVKRETENNWVVYLKTNDFVTVPGEVFGKKDTHYDCIIRYINVVPELNPYGYHFGLELLV